MIAKQSFNQVSIKRSEIVLGTVKSGDLEVTVEGYGVLKSAKKTLITSLTRATVKEILFKPGAFVTSKSTILKMENLELAQQVDNASQQLVQEKANLRQLKLNQKREVLNESANLAEINAHYQTAKLKRLAEEKLIKDGVVAKNIFESSLLNEKQLERRIKILKEREQQLFEVHQESINIQLERIKQQQGRLKIAHQRLETLQVKAGIDGVLQRLSVELGESVPAGQAIALIGGVEQLIAQIKVPQSQAQQVVIGQKVMIDTRQDKIEARVIRIDPIVENNTVTIDISLPERLPASARPHSNVDAVIVTDKLIAVNYMQKPANINGNTSVDLYKLNIAGDSAELQTLRFGKKAGRYIEIISGAHQGERFILSDMSYLTTRTLQIN